MEHERCQHQSELAEAAAEATRAALAGSSPGTAKFRARYGTLKASVDEMADTINEERRLRADAVTNAKSLKATGETMVLKLGVEREAKLAAEAKVAALEERIFSTLSTLLMDVTKPQLTDLESRGAGEERSEACSDAPPTAAKTDVLPDYPADDDDEDSHGSHESRLERITSAVSRDDDEAPEGDTIAADGDAITDDMSALTLGTSGVGNARSPAVADDDELEYESVVGDAHDNLFGGYHERKLGGFIQHYGVNDISPRVCLLPDCNKPGFVEKSKPTQPGYRYHAYCGVTHAIKHTPS